MNRYTMHRYQPGQEPHPEEIRTTVADSEDDAIDQMPAPCDGSYWCTVDEETITRTYKFKVIETRTYEMYYSVEAESLDQAREMAEIGDTTMESEVCRGGGEVINREIAEEL